MPHEAGTGQGSVEAQAQGGNFLHQANIQFQTENWYLNVKTAYHSRPGFISRFFRRVFVGERMNVGAYMWALQRISGLILLLYLLLHLYTLASALEGLEAFEATMMKLHQPVLKALEVLLLGTAFFHCLNGMRLIIFSLFVETNQKAMAIGLAVVSVLITIISIPFVF